MRRSLLALPLLLAACAGRSSGLSVSIAGPATTAYTNAIVTIQLDVHGNADSADLVADGNTVATLWYPFLYAWDTTSMDEGAHQVVAVVHAGSHHATSAPVTIVVDRTVPVVVSQSPSPDALGVRAGSGVTVTFSEPIDPHTISGAKIMLGGGIELANATLVDPVTLHIDGVSQSSFVTLVDVPSEARVDLSDVCDLAGNPLTTASWSWHLDDWLDASLSATSGARPALVLDAGGDPIVAWVEGAAGSRDLFVSRFDGSSWSPLGGALDVASAADVDAPVLALDATGEPVAAWIEAGRLRAARWTGSAWSALGTSIDGSSASAPALTTDEGGAPLLGWNEGGALHVARWTGSGWAAFGAPLPGHASGAWLLGGSTPTIGLTEPDGAPTAASWSGSNWQVFGAAPFTGLADPQPVRPLYFSGELWLIAVADSGAAGGTLHALVWSGSGWYDGFSANPGVTTAHVVTGSAPLKGSGLLKGEDAGVPAGGGPPPPQQLDPALQVVWEQDGDLQASVLDYYSFGSWRPFGDGVALPSGAASDPAIASDDLGDVWLAWTSIEAGDASVHVARMNLP